MMTYSLHPHGVTVVAGLPWFAVSGLQNMTASLGMSPPALLHRRHLHSCCSLSPAEPSSFSRNSDETQECGALCRYTNMTHHLWLMVRCSHVIILAFQNILSNNYYLSHQADTDTADTCCTQSFDSILQLNNVVYCRCNCTLMQL